jgi:hypothetical protein
MRIFVLSTRKHIGYNLNATLKILSMKSLQLLTLITFTNLIREYPDLPIGAQNEGKQESIPFQ